MNIQKHTIYQLSVPFDPMAAEDEIVFSRYLLINCFVMNGINYIRIEVEELYDSKENPSERQNMRIIDDYQFEERDLPGTLHVMLGALSNKEISGSTEITFLITLFTEIMFTENYVQQLKEYFPKWDIDHIIEQSKVPGQMAELLKIKDDIDNAKSD